MAKASLFMKQSCMKNFFVELCFSQRFHPRRCALEPVFKSLLFKSSFCKQVWMSSCKPNFDSPHYWSSFIRKLVIFHTCFHSRPHECLPISSTAVIGCGWRQVGR